MIVLEGGEVLTDQGWSQVDVGIEDDQVAAIGPDLVGDENVDVKGCLVGPAFVDMHTHLREPGQTWKEDIESAARAGLAGGFAAISAMPNTEPAMDDVKVVESVMIRGESLDLIDVIPSAALTVGRLGVSPVDFESLYDIGVRVFTDDGDSVASSELLEEIMGVIASLNGAFVAQHAEDTTMTRGGHMHEGRLSRRLGVAGLPSEAEAAVVRRDLAMAARTGARYHCQHVSSHQTVEEIRAAKHSGLDVTAEVTPHHLTFDDSWLESLDPNFKMYPPLREAVDRVALVDALDDGTIDVVATDHAPHTREEKSVDFAAAPRGVIGLETAASAVWSAGVSRDRLFDSMSTVPARLLGLRHQGNRVAVGVRANLVVFDPDTTWTPRAFHSKSSNSPYIGHPLRGSVRATIRNGQLAHQNGDSQR